MMEKRIIEFIEGQTVATVCLTDDKQLPYCFSCFYAFDSEKGLFYFKTSMNSHHGAFLTDGCPAAGTVQPDKLNRLAIKGLQFNGRFVDEENPRAAAASTIYYKRFPFALAMPGKLWAIEADWMKLTDNSLGFGKKLVWEKMAAVEP